MSNQRQKPTKRKLKPPQHEKKYMPFRAYKAKGIESKIAGYVKGKHNVDILKLKSPQRFNKFSDISPSEDLSRDNGGKQEEQKKSKLLSKNQKAKSPRKSKKSKSFDIDSFPRVFSTSDLMEKMNDGEVKSSQSSCNFQNSFDVESTDEVRVPCDNFDVHMLPERTDEEHKEFNEINFLGSSFMVFSRKRHKRRNVLEDKLTKTMSDLETRNKHVKNLTSRLEETSQSLESSARKEKNLLRKIEQREIQLGKLHVENDLLRKEKAKYEKMAKDLQVSIQNLEKELQKTKHAKEHERQQEYSQLKELINELEAEREKYSMESKKLRREINEKNEIIENLNQRCENLHKQHMVTTSGSKQEDSLIVDSLQEQNNKLKRENEKLKKTYAYTMSELADYDMIQIKLKQVINKQKNSLKLLEDVSHSETQQLQNYEMENIRLREMNKNLWSENERYKLENARLLNTLTELPSTAFIKQHHPPRLHQRKLLYLTNSEKAPKDAIKEIKNFKTSILQAFRQHQKSDIQ